MGGAVCKIDHPSTSSKCIKTLPERVMCDKQNVASLPKICEQYKPPLLKSISDDENTKHKVATALLEMNEQLVLRHEARKRNSRCNEGYFTAARDSKTIAHEIKSDPAKFPVFKKRVDA